MVFDHHLMSWLSLKELPLNVVDFRVSESFHPHYIKFLKTGITLPVPRYKTSNYPMMPGCVSFMVGIRYFFLQAGEERKGIDVWLIL